MRPALNVTNKVNLADTWGIIVERKGGDNSAIMEVGRQNPGLAQRPPESTKQLIEKRKEATAAPLVTLSAAMNRQQASAWHERK